MKRLQLRVIKTTRKVNIPLETRNLIGNTCDAFHFSCEFLGEILASRIAARVVVRGVRSRYWKKRRKRRWLDE